MLPLKQKNMFIRFRVYELGHFLFERLFDNVAQGWDVYLLPAYMDDARLLASPRLSGVTLTFMGISKGGLPGPPAMAQAWTPFPKGKDRRLDLIQA